MRISIYLIFLFFDKFILAQCDKVYLSGQVIDSLNPQAFYNVMIIDRSTGRGVFGQPDGTFSVYVSSGDKISISVKGYPIYEFMAKPDSNCQSKVIAYIEKLPQEIKEVVIRPLKTLEQIKEERQALSLRETKMVTGIEVLQSPITALYQAFSRKEKNKAWIAEQTYKNDQRKVVKELLRVYVAYEIINLTEEEFDDFVTFLNVDESFLKTASEMELIVFIKDKFDHFSMFR
jgi:tyrosyl-tRNA synthetase